jgi:hypothetical protein
VEAEVQAALSWLKEMSPQRDRDNLGGSIVDAL